MTRRLLKIAISTAVAAAFALGIVALYTPAQAARTCICPDVYSPVKCSNGVTYSNGCVASCFHATGCVPIGPI